MCNLHIDKRNLRLKPARENASGFLLLFQFVFLSPFPPSRSMCILLRSGNGDSALACARLKALAGAVRDKGTTRGNSDGNAKHTAKIRSRPLRGGFLLSMRAPRAGQSSTARTLIFFFFKRKRYAPSDTKLSKTFPIPNRSAMPRSDGVHKPARYRINAPP